MVLNHGYMASNNFNLDIPEFEGKSVIWQLAAKGHRFYVGFPIAHAGGVQVALSMTAYNDVCICMAQTGYLRGDTMEAMIDHAGVRGCLIMPRTCIELAQNGRALSKLRNLELFCYSGGKSSLFAEHSTCILNKFLGPLPLDVGEKLARYCNPTSSWV